MSMFDNISSKKLSAHKRQMWPSRSDAGFTIVELVVIIAVIAVLAAIIIVSYNGHQDRAARAALRSDLSNAAEQLGIDDATNGVYPGSESAADGGRGLPKSPGTSYRYDYVAADNSYCLTAFSDRPSVPPLSIKNDGFIQDGPCTGSVADDGGGGGGPGIVATFAGSGEYGFADGAGASAKFIDPSGVAVDSSGNVYVADNSNSCIRKITPAGAVTTFAGLCYSAGYVDGTGTGARFSFPRGVAIAGDNSLYVADGNNHRIRKVTPAGVVTTLAGSGVAGYVDGTGTGARFNNPAGIAVDGSGNVYVAEYGNNRIRKITPAGAVTTFAGSGVAGYAEGVGTSARFNNPQGVAIDSSGNVYVGDADNHRIRKITPAGAVTTFAGSGVGGHADGTGINAQFNRPWRMTIASDGNLYVADFANERIRKVTPAGVVTTVAGSGDYGYVDGPGLTAQFRSPSAVAVSGTSLYVADTYNRRVRVIQLP